MASNAPFLGRSFLVALDFADPGNLLPNGVGDPFVQFKIVACFEQEFKMNKERGQYDSCVNEKAVRANIGHVTCFGCTSQEIVQ